MPGAHAALSPSAAKRWIACPPSARLNQKYIERFGEKSSPYAEEGTKAHALAELKLRKENGEINEFSFNEQKKLLGDITAEMDKCTDLYVDTVLEEFYLAKRKDEEAQLFIEQRLSMEKWIPGCFGTSDSVVVSKNGIVIIDYKNGAGVPVNAVDNPQLRIYALGAVDAFQAIYEFQHIKTVICQPRLDSVTSEELTLDELLNWADTAVVPFAKLAHKGEGEFHTGEHCRFCNVRAICRTRLNELLDLAATGFESPDIMPDDVVAGLLPFLSEIEKYVSDLREYALNRAKQGETLPGYKLVRGRRPGRKWTDENAVLDQCARAGYSEDQYLTPRSLKSCSEMEKMMGKKAYDALLKSFTFQGEGALVLAPTDDPREAVGSAESTFADIVSGN